MTDRPDQSEGPVSPKYREGQEWVNTYRDGQAHKTPAYVDWLRLVHSGKPF